jgi:tRNA (cmo5U34)-methyltransferase
MQFDPAVFERSVHYTITGYDRLQPTVIDTALSKVSDPKIWLDAGCGTGTLVKMALERSPKTQFVLADPGAPMLDQAKRLLHSDPHCSFVQRPTDALNFGDGTLDVITAILSNHYYPRDDHEKAVRNCFRMLRKGGVFVYVEHIDPKDGDYAEWRENQLKGKSEEEVDAFFARLNKEFFVLPIDDHIDLLNRVGFSSFEVFWRTCGDIGFVAVK